MRVGVFIFFSSGLPPFLATDRDYVSARTTVGGVVPDRTTSPQPSSRAQQPGTVDYAAASGHVQGTLSAFVERWGPDPRSDDSFAFMRALIDVRDALYVRPRPL